MMHRTLAVASRRGLARSAACRRAGRPAAMLALIAVTGLGASPAAAQDRFGAAVAVTERGEVLVTKPGFGRGPAALLVFDRDGTDGWSLRETVWAEGSTRGESFGGSLALFDGGILVASGDPEIRYGAYGFERLPDGWGEAAPIGLAEATAEGGDGITVAAIFAILQPPPRDVAAGERTALVAAPDEAGGTTVRAFERTEDGTWRETGPLEPEELDANAGFGTSMALRGDRAVVGAPGHGPSGAVFLFARGEDGGWSPEAVLSSPDLRRGSGLGRSVAFAGDDEVIAGAPRASLSRGAVVHFASRSGGWTAVQTLAPPEDERGHTFGSALAVSGKELRVGAPGAADARGAVHAFTRAAPGGEWRPAGTLAPDGLEPRASFGSALALGGDLLVVGSPGASGSMGAAAVFEREGDGWSAPRWLRAGGEREAITGAEMRCEEDAAAGYDCSEVDLLAYLPLSAIGAGPGERVSDNWGWTDPETGREYALVGRTGGAVILDITEPTDPRYLGTIPANPSGARDLKTYRDHLFFTGDGAGAHGLVVFDLTRLRDVTAAPVDFEPDARWDGIGSAHNLVIDTEAGFAFTVSTSGEGETCGGGLVMIDIREPLTPSFAGCYTDTEGLLFPGRTHDAQCVVYRGPDEDYRGRELCFASNETALRIVDVTDKANPVPISAAAYPGVAYIHQGWLTEDQRYFFLDDELDELVGTTDRTKTIIWDLTDLDDPVVAGEHYGPNASTDHNLYIAGDRMYQANYQAGLRVIDVSDPENPREVGFFDTTPYGVDPPGFNGAWTAYPFFESGTVLVTSMLEGVFLLEPRREELVP